MKDRLDLLDWCMTSLFPRCDYVYYDILLPEFYIPEEALEIMRSNMHKRKLPFHLEFGHVFYLSLWIVNAWMWYIVHSTVILFLHLICVHFIVCFLCVFFLFVDVFCWGFAENFWQMISIYLYIRGFVVSFAIMFLFSYYINVIYVYI